jgi:heat shock protein beta
VQLTWDAALPQLKTDPRFTQSPLPPNQQMHLFQSHILQLRAKHLDNLRALFESHAPSLATPFSDLPLSSLLSSLPATKLGYDDRDLEAEYDKWHRERNTEAKRAFDQMLGENAFVEFWGRLGKMGGEGVNGGVKADEEGEEDDGTGGGGKADMKQLAKSIDLKEMQKVLKVI